MKNERITNAFGDVSIGVFNPNSTIHDWMVDNLVIRRKINE